MEVTKVVLSRGFNEHNVVYTYIYITLFSLKKEGNFDTCYNMDETWRGTLKEISQSQKDSYCMITFYSRVCMIVRFIEKGRMVISKGWGEKGNGELFNERRLSALQDEKVLEIFAQQSEYI